MLGIGVLGFVAVAAATAWICWRVASTQGCARGAVVCIINGNGGLGALYGVVLAALAAGVTLLIRALDQDSERQRFTRVRRQAVYETWHNLQHFGSSWRKYGRVGNRADLSLERATELASDPLIRRLSPSQAEHVDHMRRNAAVLGRIRWNANSEDARNHAQWFIEQAFRFLIDVGRQDPETRNMINEFRVRPDRTESDVLQPLIALAQALGEKDLRWTVRFDFSQKLQDEQPSHCHVVCWRCTADPLGRETVHVLGESLAGLRDPP